MLDTSLENIHVLMRRPAGLPRPEPAPLRESHSIRLYQPGDREHWAAIETSVLEFTNETAAAAYHDTEFGSAPLELLRRQLFAVNACGVPVGTASAWWMNAPVGYLPCVHWVAVKPEAQGLGLGRALVAEVIRLLIELEGDVDLYLTSQTRSHKALRIYRAFGFDFDTQNPWPYPGKQTNTTAEAVAYLTALNLL